MAQHPPDGLLVFVLDHHLVTYEIEHERSQLEYFDVQVMMMVVQQVWNDLILNEV
jgi:hypothetical protein